MPGQQELETLWRRIMDVYWGLGRHSLSAPPAGMEGTTMCWSKARFISFIKDLGRCVWGGWGAGRAYAVRISGGMGSMLTTPQPHSTL